MKKIKLLFLLLTFQIIQTQSIQAKDVGVYNLSSHWTYLALQGGPYLLTDKNDEISLRPYFTIGLSGGYEYRYSAFWTSIGMDLQYWSVKLSTDQTYQYDLQLYDTQGKLMNYHYLIGAGSEVPQGVSLNLPILVGFHVKGFYMGVGVKVGTSLFSVSRVTRKYQTYASYPQYISDFEDMPGHYYSDYKKTSVGKIGFQWPISGIVEIGYDAFETITNYNQRYRLKIAMYAEYGLNNIWRNKTETPIFVVDSDHPVQLNFNPYYGTHRYTEESKVIPMSAGLKLTLLFRIPTKDCNCL